MEPQSIPNEMMHYFSQLNDAEQKSVLGMIKTFLRRSPVEMNVPSLKEYNQELEQADAEIEAGDFVTHEEVMERYSKLTQ